LIKPKPRLSEPARADSELCGVVHDRLIDGKLKGNAQFDSLDDGCGKFAISNLIRHADAVTYALMVSRADPSGSRA
jgi:hypothetical protein